MQNGDTAVNDSEGIIWVMFCGAISTSNLTEQLSLIACKSQWNNIYYWNGGCLPEAHVRQRDSKYLVRGGNDEECRFNIITDSSFPEWTAGGAGYFSAWWTGSFLDGK